MSHIFEIIKKYSDKICTPNPDAIKSEATREILYRQNKNVLFIQIMSFISMVIYIRLTNKSPTPVQKISFLAIFLNTSVFVLTCRSYPNIFRAYYFCLVTLFGPCSINYNTDSVFFSYVGVFILPTWMLYLTGSKVLFSLQLFLQITFLHVFYKPLLTEKALTMIPEEYVQRIVNITSYGVFINCVFLLGTHMALIKAYQRVTITTNKKAELQRQRVFLLGFSHELRNLINSMVGSIQLCTLEAVSEKVLDLLQNAEICGELLTHLITNILDTGKVEAGDLEIQSCPNEIHNTLEKVWNVNSHIIKNKRLRGNMKIQTSIPSTLKYDNYRLTQILMNLISNAVKFTDSGKINVDVLWFEGPTKVMDSHFGPIPFDEEGLFEKSQTISVLREDLIHLDLNYKKKIAREGNNRVQRFSNGVLKFIVTDTGCGIDSTRLPSLFKRFSQVNEDLSKGRLGTGLGLFITKELIERMNGEIRAYSKLGKGTVMIVCLPVEIVETQRPAMLDTSIFMGALKTLKLKAMIVDDIEFNLIIISNFLTKLGIEVTEIARNGKEAVDKYKENVRNGKSFDIITMDIDMPIMDGKEATKLIRAYEEENNLEQAFISVVSGNCSLEEIGECIDVRGNSGAQVFLKKPVTIDDLRKIIKGHFEKKAWTMPQHN